MDKEILELIQEIKEMKTEMNTKLDKLDFQIKDGFETLEIKIDEVEL